MQGAGIRAFGAAVEILDLPESYELQETDVLIEVRAAGVGNWDEIARNGGWDLGIVPPMALGVEASGIVIAVGSSVRRFAEADEVLTHPVPLRHQGAWAERLVAVEATVARKPPDMSWPTAALFPVPALTAGQVIHHWLQVQRGEPLLIHGGNGGTGARARQAALPAGCWWPSQPQRERALSQWRLPKIGNGSPPMVHRSFSITTTRAGLRRRAQFSDRMEHRRPSTQCGVERHV